MLAILLLTLQSICFKLFSERVMRSSWDALSFTAVLSLFVALLSVFFVHFPLQVSGVTLLLGICYGVCYVGCEIAFAIAMGTGPMSYTSLFLSCAMVIPTLVGLLLWQEKITGFQWLGIGLLIAAFFCGNLSPNGEKKVTVRWLCFGVATFLFNGMVSVIQKAHQMAAGDAKLNEFLLVSFSSAAVFAFAVWGIRALLARGKQKPEDGEAAIPLVGNWKFYLAALCTALCAVWANKFVLYSASRMNASILFPVLNGSILILSTAVSVVFF